MAESRVHRLGRNTDDPGAGAVDELSVLLAPRPLARWVARDLLQRCQRDLPTALAIAEQLNADQLAGRAPVPRFLPIPRCHRGEDHPVLAGGPTATAAEPPARDLAGATRDELALYVEAAHRLGLQGCELDVVERTGLICRVDDRIEVTDVLAASAVVAGCTAHEVYQAHRLLAELLHETAACQRKWSPTPANCNVSGRPGTWKRIPRCGGRIVAAQRVPGCLLAAEPVGGRRPARTRQPATGSSCGPRRRAGTRASSRTRPRRWTSYASRTRRIRTSTPRSTCCPGCARRPAVAVTTSGSGCSPRRPRCRACSVCVRRPRPSISVGLPTRARSWRPSPVTSIRCPPRAGRRGGQRYSLCWPAGPTSTRRNRRGATSASARARAGKSCSCRGCGHRSCSHSISVRRNSRLPSSSGSWPGASGVEPGWAQRRCWRCWPTAGSFAVSGRWHGELVTEVQSELPRFRHPVVTAEIWLCCLFIAVRCGRSAAADEALGQFGSTVGSAVALGDLPALDIVARRRAADSDEPGTAAEHALRVVARTPRSPHGLVLPCGTAWTCWKR